MTIEEYNFKIIEKYGINTFKVFESNQNITNRDRILVKCLKCNDVFEVPARSFIRRRSGDSISVYFCKNCNKIKRETLLLEKETRKSNKILERTSETLEEKLSNKFTILKNEYPKLEVKCNKCGNIFSTSFYNLSENKGCRRCSGTEEFTVETLQEESDKRFGKNRYKIIEIYSKQYKTCKKRFVKVQFGEEKEVFSKSVSEFLRYGFERKVRQNLDHYNSIILNNTNSRYRICEGQDFNGVNEYYFIEDTLREIKKKFLLKDFVSNGFHFYRSTFSSYTILVFQVLNKRKEFFKKEKSFYGIGKRKFDIELSDGRLIEIDGEQHFKPFKVTDVNSFLNTIKSDRIKNTFCLEKNKILIRIPYTYFKNKRQQIEELITLFIEKKYDLLMTKYNNCMLIIDGCIKNEAYYVPVINFLKNNNYDCESLELLETPKSSEYQRVTISEIGQSAAEPNWEGSTTIQ